MTKQLYLAMLSLAIIAWSCKQTTVPGSAHNEIETQGDTTGKELEVGGPCDKCDLMFEGMPAIDNIGSTAIIAGSDEPGEKMELKGTVVMPDSKTPAKNTVLYIYHTDAKGYYAPADTQTMGRMNGHLRNWLRTGEDGRFKISSIRPAPYPNRGVPAHIHILVKEPGKTRYYIDEVWFDDDPLVTQKLRDKAEKRGGDMIIRLEKNSDNVWEGNLKITLGLNIPGYK
jgi:protocatechuate 3,4-dioxygenase beta subunit